MSDWLSESVGWVREELNTVESMGSYIQSFYLIGSKDVISSVIRWLPIRFPPSLTQSQSICHPRYPAISTPVLLISHHAILSPTIPIPIPASPFRAFHFYRWWWWFHLTAESASLWSSAGFSFKYAEYANFPLLPATNTIDVANIA